MPMPPPPPLDHMGARIRWARSLRALSQAELARRVGVRQPSVANWENAVNEPRPDKIKRLARILDASPSWLMRGEGAPDAREPAAARLSYLSRPVRHVPIFDAPELAGGFDPERQAPADFIAYCQPCERPFAVRAQDPAMIALAPLGALVVFDAAETALRDGAVYLLDFEGRLIWRRWRSAPSRLEAAAPGAETLYPERAPRAFGRAICVIAPLGEL